jgi:hypothetical protein
MRIKFKNATSDTPKLEITGVKYFEPFSRFIQFTSDHHDSVQTIMIVGDEHDYEYDGEVYDFCEVYGE